MANKNINGDVNVQFTEAQSRQTLDSGESVKTLFGKVKKWLTDLKPVAFSGSYNDLTDKPDIPTSNREIYGFAIYENSSGLSGDIEYVADAFGKKPARLNPDGTFDWGDWKNAFFIPRPCMLKYDGTVDYYLDPDDYTKKEDGTPSDVANLDYEGNAMMEFPLIYYSSNNAIGNCFYVANYKVDDSYQCYCNYDCDGNVIPHFYMAIYQGYGTEKTRSISGVMPTIRTVEQSVNEALANNTNSEIVEWYTDVFCDRQLVTMLLILISKAKTLGKNFGRGYFNKTLYTTGLGNDKGLFYGDITNLGSMMKVFGMENFWGNTQRYLAGLKLQEGGSTSIPYTYYIVKNTWSTVDGSTEVGYTTQASASGMINDYYSYGQSVNSPLTINNINLSAKRLFAPKKVSTRSAYTVTEWTESSISDAYFDTFMAKTSNAQSRIYLVGVGGYFYKSELNSYLKYVYTLLSNAYEFLETNLSKGLSCKPHISKFNQIT